MELISAEFHNVFRFGETENKIVFDDLFGPAGSPTADSIALIVGSNNGDENDNNGAGKSAIMEGIFWCFYERLPRLIRNSTREGASVQEIVRTEDDGTIKVREAFVEVRFRTKEGKVARIKRGRKISAKGNTSPVLEVEVDGKPLSASRKAEPEKAIRDLIGVDHEAFLNSVLFAQKDSGKFLSGTDMDRRDILINLLNFDIVDKMLKIVRRQAEDLAAETGADQVRIQTIRGRSGVADADKMKKRVEAIVGETRMQELASAAMEALTTPDPALPETLAKAKAEVARLEAARDAVSKEAEDKAKAVETAVDGDRRRLEAIEAELKDCASGRPKLETRFKAAQATVKSFTPESLAARTEKVKDAKDKMRACRQTLEREQALHVEAAEKLGKARGEKEMVRAALVDLKGRLPKASGDKITCPTCGGEWDVTKLKAEVAEKDKAYAEILRAIGLMENSDEEVKTKITVLDATLVAHENAIWDESQIAADAEKVKAAKESVEECKEQAAEIKGREAKANTEKAGLEKKVAEARAEAASIRAEIRSKLVEAGTKVVDAKAALGDAADAVNKEAENIRIAKQKLKEIAAEIAKLQSELAGLTAKMEAVAKDEADAKALEASVAVKTRQYSRFRKCETVLSGNVKNEIADMCVPDLNHHANRFLGILRGAVSIDIRNEGRKMPVGVTGGTASSYRMLSGGEQDAIRLAVDIALSVISANGYADLPDMIFLDEVFGSLDPMTKKNVFTLIESLKENFGRVLVVTHDPVLKEKFRTVCRVEKTDGISKIRYEKRS